MCMDAAHTGPRSFIFGASVQARISDAFSVEANVLHRPINSMIINTEFLPNGVNNTYTDHFTAVRTWEFPVMLKYTLPASPFTGRLRPFLAAGPSFRTQEDAAGTEPSRFGGIRRRWSRLPPGQVQHRTCASLYTMGA